MPSLMGEPASSTDAAWNILPGMILRVTGPDASGASATEDVAVSAVGPTGFAASFRRAYPKGLTSIAAFGNPGPRAMFHPARYPKLIPHFSVIR
jgi:hypothetical protein